MLASRVLWCGLMLRKKNAFLADIGKPNMMVGCMIESSRAVPEPCDVRLLAEKIGLLATKS